MAAGQGDQDAKSTLNDCDVISEGMEISLSEAAEISRLKSEVDRVKAEFEFSCYTSALKGNPAMSFSLLRKAAWLGHAKAQFILGGCYELAKGVAKNLTEAEKWYRKGAENGDADAQFNLGCRYFHGDHVKKNLAEAAMWLRKAAEQGHASMSCQANNTHCRYSRRSGSETSICVC